MRRKLVVRGVVQGVGFRPFAFGLATRLGLTGYVKNRAGEVVIEIEGSEASVARFVDELSTRPPPLAHVADVRAIACEPRGDAAFCIEASESTAEQAAAFVSPDIGTCDACLQELFDPRDRRYRYPFLNCTNCGPRLTIVRALPYDRERSTMAAFAMCAACRAEYEDPADRRFHAQPTACPACGPRLELRDAKGESLAVPDVLAHVAEALLGGAIVAIKGLGGYHLACRADSRAAVSELRRRKRRDEKPFAVLVPNLESAEAFAHLGAEDRPLLASPARPIVLLPSRESRESRESRPRDGRGLAAEIAPGGRLVGIMLPYTPLHHLLCHEVNGAPLVMTSGNRSDEPIAYLDGDALARLSGVADLFVLHDRPIHLRCDDSVCRVVVGAVLPVRRSRGYAPLPVGLPRPLAYPSLAVGGQLKSTFALGQGAEAIVSHHLGDLDHYEAYEAYRTSIPHYERLYGITPRVIVHDLHPDYASTRYALERAEAEGLSRVVVQHHHAHLASCMTDNGLDGTVIGVTFDGAGLGTDGAIWGGEFLVGGPSEVERLGHLRYVAMPGGEQAMREPWRMAVSYLLDAGIDPTPFVPPERARSVATMEQMIARRVRSPLTSSAGRLFDAVAAIALLGGREHVSFEGQAAMQLEALAEAEEGTAEPYAFAIDDGESARFVVDTRPLVRGVAADAREGRSAGVIAARFHVTLAAVVEELCTRIARERDLDRVVVSGGVFMNAVLSRGVSERLDRRGLRAYRHGRVPPNDGGIGVGQLAIAAARMA